MGLGCWGFFGDYYFLPLLLSYSNLVPPWILSGIGAHALNRPPSEHLSLICELK